MSRSAFFACICIGLISWILLVSATCQAQLTVTGGLNATTLAQMLAGPGVTVSNATITGSAAAAGSFNGTASNIGLPSGVILCTGPVTIAPGPNNQIGAGQDNGQPGNTLLNGLAGANTYNAIVLEFDFVPLSNTIEFNYVFASEEYPEFVNSGFNDAFAFYISGPGITGQQNIALVPGTTTPVTIDNINAGSNAQYYVNNAGGATVQYDAFTTVLTASSAVQACQTYHLKLMIADAGDGIYDSAVFLEEGSLTSAVVQITTTTATADSTAYENCSNAMVTFTLSETISTDYTVNYTISGTATNGIDFPAIPASVTIPANTLSTSFQIEPVFDGVAEGVETLILEVETSVCGSDTIIIYINDVSPVTVQAYGDTTFCGGTAMLYAVAQGGAGGHTYSWSNGMTTDTIYVSPTTTTTYTVTVNDYCASTVPAPSDDVTVTIDPTPMANAGPDISYCAGDPVTLTASGGDSYSWFDLTNNQPIGNTAVITVNPVGNVDLQLVAWIGACSDTDLVSLSELPSSPASAVGDTAFCPGGMAQLNVVNANNSSFQWTPATALSSTTTQNPTASPNTTTTYTVTVTNISGCVKTDSVTVTILPIPMLDFSVAPVCLNNSSAFQNLSSISTGNIQSLSWNLGDGTSSSDYAPSHLYTQDGSYAVTLVAVSDQGCADSISRMAVVHPLPTADFAFNNDCLDKQIQFTDNSSVASGSIAAWNWDFGNDQSASVQQPSPQTYPSSGIFNVSLHVISDNGCEDDTTQTIEIYPLPVANFTFDSVCAGLPITFTDLSTANGPYAIASYQYDLSDGQSATVADPSILFAQPGMYQATLTVTTTMGCIDQITRGDAVVFPVPTSAFAPDLKNCLNDTTRFFDQSTISSIFNDQIVARIWDFGDGNTSTDTDPDHVFGTYGMFPVSLITVTDKGCSDSISHNVEIFPLPEVGFTSDRTEGCQPLRVLFSEQVQIPAPYTIAQYSWSLGNGTGQVTSQDPMTVYQNDTVDPLQTTSYTVSLQAVSGNGCVSSDTVVNYITEYPKPTALFAADPWISNVISPEFHFTDLSSINVAQWNWDLGDGSFYTEQHPTHIYPAEAGKHDVTLYVTTEFGCKDTVSATVEVEPVFTFYIPNSFTPNQDGVNETFYGTGEGFSTYQMSIYDRWGELIFRSNDPSYPWDGTFKGKQVEQGVYIYHFYILDWKNDDHEYRGHVTLLR